LTAGNNSEVITLIGKYLPSFIETTIDDILKNAETDYKKVMSIASQIIGHSWNADW
jgi:hypothetical protein